MMSEALEKPKICVRRIGSDRVGYGGCWMLLEAKSVKGR